MKEVVIRGDQVELVKLLKFESLVGSGGEAKIVIGEGLVRVNGEVETRKRRKLVAGDVVQFGDDELRISPSSCP